MSGFRYLRWVMAVVLAAAWTAASADDARFVYYDVAGHTATKLRQELDVKGPLDRNGKRFDGRTTWRLNWTYRYAPDGNGCRFTGMSASLAGTIILPRWTHSEHASHSLVKKWDGYLAALRIHEEGHYAHGVAAKREVETLGQSFRIPGDCKEIARIFNDEASAIVARYMALDVTYDRDTGHGETQGATFP